MQSDDRMCRLSAESTHQCENFKAIRTVNIYLAKKIFQKNKKNRPKLPRFTVLWFRFRSKILQKKKKSLTKFH